MSNNSAFSADTLFGTVWILPGLDRRWHVIWDGEDLGAFLSPQAAALHAGEGNLRASFGLLSENLALPKALSEWTAYQE